MANEHVFTIDSIFDGLENLKKSVEEARKILDKETRILGYYLMTYTDTTKLGVKIIIKKENITEVVNELKSKLIKIKGFQKISQEKNEGEATEDSYLSSIAMKTRNEVFDLLKGDVSPENYNKMLGMLIHYISNPLFISYREEFIACLNHLLRLYDSK